MKSDKKIRIPVGLLLSLKRQEYLTARSYGGTYEAFFGEKLSLIRRVCFDSPWWVTSNGAKLSKLVILPLPSAAPGPPPGSSSSATPTPETPDEADCHKGDTSRCRPKTLNQAEEAMSTVRPAGSRHPLLDRTNERTYLLPLK